MERSLWNKSFPARGRSVIPLRGGWLLLPAILWAGATSLSAATFTASLDRNSVLVGETVALTLKFEGGAPKAIPAIPQIPGIQFAPGYSMSVKSSIGPDGTTTSVQTHAINLQPIQAGDFVIPAMTVEINGQKLASQPLRLTVLQTDPATPPPELADQMAFLWLVLPKKEVYVGEVIVAELRLYLRSGVGNISNFQVPPLTGEGYNTGKLLQGQQFQRRVGTTPFTVLPFLIPLTPVKTGLLTIGPLSASVMVHFGQTDIFGRHTQRSQVALSLAQQHLQVLPLPTQNVPPGFNGAVGTYEMTVSAGPTNIATGDPITVKVRITGRAALEALTLPQQNAWHDFKTYPPTANVETTDSLGLQGAKTFEQIVVPQTTDIKELPPFSFSFFDPDAKAYRTLTHPAVKLFVRSGGTTVAPLITTSNTSNPDIPPPTQDIVPIKQRLGALAQAGPPLVQQPWFIALQTLPLLAWLSVLGWRKRAVALANNPRLRRQRLAAKIIRDGLADLRRLAAENKSDEFFATLFRLLQEQLGERLDCPASAITEAVIDERLRPRRLPEATLIALHELFQTCNLARYAPMKSSQELAALIPKLETALRELQKIRA